MLTSAKLGQPNIPVLLISIVLGPFPKLSVLDADIEMLGIGLRVWVALYPGPSLHFSMQH